MDDQLAAYMKSVLHWKARFLAVGVPLRVFEQVVESIGVWDDWPRLWRAAAMEEAGLGEREAGAGHTATAGDAWLRATLYLHFAQFVLFDDEEARRELVERKREAFDRALPFLSPPGERLTVGADDGRLHGVLRLPGEGLPPYPVVIVLPGADSTKEEYVKFEDLLLRRGLATLSIDGPGQGETRFGGYPFRSDYETAFPPVMDWIDQEERLDAGRIGLVGYSFGGYLAPRVSAACREIRAAVSLGGCYDLSYWDQLPALLKEDLRYMWGQPDLGSARRFALDHISLEPVLAGLDAELLVVHGTKDAIFRAEDARRLAEEAARGELQMYEGGDHCCHNVSHLSKPLIADWVSDRLASRS